MLNGTLPPAREDCACISRLSVASRPWEALPSARLSPSLTHRRRSGHEVDFPCLLCWLAALLLAFTIHAPAVADSRTAVSCGFHNTVLEDGTVSISQYQGTAEPLVIPATLDGRTVTVIGRETLDAFSHVVSVSIPDTVTAIDSKAFYGCPTLEFVGMPDSVTSIGKEEFSGCASLRSIVIPDTVTEIGPFAFLDCASLTSFTLPDSVTELGATPLSRCSRLRSIDVSPGHPTFSSMNGGAVPQGRQGAHRLSLRKVGRCLQHSGGGCPHRG